MKNKSIKIITEAGLFTGIYAVFVLISLASGGFLESLLFFVLPFPMVLFSIRHDSKKSFLLYVAMIIICGLISPLSMVFYIIPAGALGILYGYLKKNNFKEVIQIITTVITCFIVNTLTMYVFGALFGYSIYDDFGTTINVILKFIDSLFKTNLATTKLNFYIDLLVPSIILVTSLIEGYLMHIVCSMMLERLGYSRRKNIPFFLLQLPIWTGIASLALIILGIFILRFANNMNNVIFEISKFVLSLGFMGYILLFIQGIGRIACHLLAKGKGKIFPIVLLLSLLLNILVIIFGFISIFNDNRDDLLYNVGWKE